MESHALFLHAADAMSHTSTWALAAWALGGAMIGAAVSWGGTLTRRYRARETAAEFVLRASGVRDGTWWAEIEQRDARSGGLPIDGWRLVTVGGALAPTVEPLAPDGSPQRFGLVAAIGDAPAVRLEWRANGRVAWSVDLAEPGTEAATA